MLSGISVKSLFDRSLFTTVTAWRSTKFRIMSVIQMKQTILSEELFRCKLPGTEPICCRINLCLSNNWKRSLWLSNHFGHRFGTNTRRSFRRSSKTTGFMLFKRLAESDLERQTLVIKKCEQQTQQKRNFWIFLQRNQRTKESKRLC